MIPTKKAALSQKQTIRERSACPHFNHTTHTAKPKKMPAPALPFLFNKINVD
jgi:hypothetical protein